MKTIEKAISNAAKAEFLEDIIFEGRNHNYGAYTLRKNYNNNLLFSLLGVSAFAVAVVLLAFLHSAMNPPVIELPTDYGVILDPTIIDFPITEIPELPAQKQVNSNNNTTNDNGIPVVTTEEVTKDPTPQDILIDEVGSQGETNTGTIEPPITPPAPIVDLTNTTFDQTQVTTQALFMDGTVENFRKWLAKRINYPEEAVVNEVKGKVILKFTIDKTGKICDISLMRGVHPAIDQAAIDALKRSPKWTAATIEGKPVKVSYIVPIAFCIEKN